MRMSEGDSLPKDYIKRHKSRHENKCEQAKGTHFLEATSGGTSKGHIENASGRGELTLCQWRPHREGNVRIHEECDIGKATHSLETAS